MNNIKILDKEILEIKEKIINAVTVEKLYLFGSYAYGNPNANSDYDFYIVLSKNDMRILCNLCCKIESGFNSVLKAAVLLTRYSVIPHYPAELGLIESDAKKAIEYTDDVISFVISKLK